MAAHTVNSRPMVDLIAEHLARSGSITALEAHGLYRCRSLSRRITDLKKQGWRITSQWREDETGQRYVRYWF